MTLVVITAIGAVEDEWNTIKELFDMGLPTLHVRKPGWTNAQLKNWLDGIDEAYYPYLSIHGDKQLGEVHHLGGFHLRSNQPVEEGAQWKGRLSKSFHEWSELDEKTNDQLDYAFLSPVFDSLSKVNYQARWSEETLKRERNKRQLPFQLFALGGVSFEKLDQIKRLGFDGAAILGSVWKHERRIDRVNAFKELAEQWQMMY